jgi:hypothetical protein
MGPIRLEDKAIAAKVLRAKELLGVAAAIKMDIMDRSMGLAARRCPRRLLSMGRKGMVTGVDSY